MARPSGTYENLVGRVFGRLTVIAFDHSQIVKRGTRTYWRCKCICGIEKVIRSDGLKGGDNVSCGCKKIDQLTIHGDTGTPEHKTWCSMIERCHTETNQNFALYGGTGISVCLEWRASFSAFLEHIGRRPSAKHSIDRYPDNAGNYEPGNVRWATRKQQQRNIRSNALDEEKVREIRNTPIEPGMQARLAKKFGMLAYYYLPCSER